MDEIIKRNNKLIVEIDEKYVHNVVIVNSIDNYFVGVITCLKDMGRLCKFLGFNSLNGHVVLINGIKYCTSGIDMYGYWGMHTMEFTLVEDLDHDYKENRFGDRVEKILNILEK